MGQRRRTRPQRRYVHGGPRGVARRARHRRGAGTSATTPICQRGRGRRQSGRGRRLMPAALWRRRPWPWILCGRRPWGRGRARHR
uniref:Uncharacterized protein n=1 Tax=Arundo donax TaxID=35708 RepID=A0A0A9F2P3_ARUDO